jgi:hypothetical protein
MEAFAQLARSGGYYMGMSVGLDANKVVIPPDFLAGNSKKHLGEAIRAWRSGSRAAISGVTKLQGFCARVEKGMGLQFDISSALKRAGQKVAEVTDNTCSSGDSVGGSGSTKASRHQGT